ncbi:hypothetical protein ACWD26_42180 [Streptomyces sp. NPDC002787]
MIANYVFWPRMFLPRWTLDRGHRACRRRGRGRDGGPVRASPRLTPAGQLLGPTPPIVTGQGRSSRRPVREEEAEAGAGRVQRSARDRISSAISLGSSTVMKWPQGTVR